MPNLNGSVFEALMLMDAMRRSWEILMSVKERSAVWSNEVDERQVYSEQHNIPKKANVIADLYINLS